MVQTKTGVIPPEAIYFDTNVLLELPNWNPKPDFVKLINLSRRTATPCYAPEIVLKEFINRKVIKALELANNIENKTDSLSKLLVLDELKADLPQDIENRIKGYAEKYFEAVGISVIGTPNNIPLDLLVDMASKKEPPFGETGQKEKKSDKGFKDTMILFTIIEHMKKESYSDSIFVSRDKIFSEKAISERLQSEKLNLLIQNGFKEAQEYIVSQLIKVGQEIEEKEISEITNYLNENFKIISDYIIENSEVSEDYLLGRGFYENEEYEGFFGNINKVLSVIPKSIVSVSKDYASEQKDPDSILILFSVSTEFLVLLEQYGFGLLLNRGPKFHLSEIIESGEAGKRIEKGKATVEVEKTILRNFTVNAKIHIKDNTFKGLEFLNSYPS
jgi:hypothetical protein